MRERFLLCIVIGLVTTACSISSSVAPSPTSIPTHTPVPTLTFTSTLTSTIAPTPTETLTPQPTVTTTPLPLTHLDLWLTTEKDSATSPVVKLRNGSAKVLYIWARAPEGTGSDFTLQATLQDGVKVILGPTFQTEAGAQPTDCGYWEGGYLTRPGKVTVRALVGKLEVGSVTFSIY